ncbi:related to double substrate-specificity short chain dehydrogenase/reductase 2 [Ramularia collo-cygni]|uniref:Related to double substrate-specificity short chain dehydrogenase/reductase 2 n=1 Tax=Ramularia collo-cygni TaxID=112498 RepID=A0A2D3US10_9PEZI|nr:related to double substrate-specificity short chain dehydrogenase/reductase 2 [Ramularia collo-cygni]CZT14337.1 related to double substrate-specificity short chain dehydrogenase/reductase 2 [Ramularia collo-cygni]
MSNLTQCQASQSPACLVLAGRSPSKMEECIIAIKKDFPNTNFRTLHMDLSSQKSVRAAAAEFLSWSTVPKLDILVNSAGVMGIPEHTLTPEGIEMHLGCNHIGHYLFTNLIAPKLIKAAESSPKGHVRVVNVSSGSPAIAGFRWSDYNFEKVNNTLPEAEQPNYTWLEGWGYKDVQSKSYVPIDAYNRSKVANLLFAVGANKRWFEQHGILTLALHPGVIETELKRDFAKETKEAVAELGKKGLYKLKTLGAGAATSLVAALDPALAKGVGQERDGKENYGSYLMDCQISEKADPRAISSAEAEKLWALSEELVGEKFA